ncbi:MAG TPA: OmpH family outer membrane protein [Tepidisphaeraceae bacterium]|jgi:Skp family chaperone for outer membrane proteins
MRQLFVPALLLCLLAVPASAQTKIAVANPIKILNGLQETKDLNEKMKTDQTAVETEAKERVAKIKAIQDQRDQLKPDAPQWAELNKQFVQARNEAQTWQQTTQQELARKFRDQAMRMNEKITKDIADVAKAKGFDMVLAEQNPELSPEQLAGMQPQQVMGVLFGSRNVLFAAGTADLTQDVITRLDAGYKSPGGALPTPAK